MRFAMFYLVIGASIALARGTASAHAGNLDQAPWHACEGLSLSAICSFENAAHDVHRGTCRSVADALLCVRNRPIEHAAGTVLAAQPAHASVGFYVIALLALLNVPLVLQRLSRRAST